MTFEHPEIKSSHGSKNLPNRNGLAAATSAVLLALLLALWIGFARGPIEPERLKRYAAACVCAFVCFGKVLSPQFLIWLVPVVPLVRGKRGVAAAALLAAALINTQVWFPGRYFKDYAWDAQLSLAWVLRDPRVTSALIGVSSIQQLEDNVAALRRLDFDADELAEIDRYAKEGAINIWAPSNEA